MSSRDSLQCLAPECSLGVDSGSSCHILDTLKVEIDSRVLISAPEKQNTARQACWMGTLLLGHMIERGKASREKQANFLDSTIPRCC